MSLVTKRTQKYTTEQSAAVIIPTDLMGCFSKSNIHFNASAILYSPL
jgi:hypothetical protein